MAENNNCRYKCVTRLDKKTLTGKTDYRDRYVYQILDKQSGKVMTLYSHLIKSEMAKGTQIEGLELSSDGRIFYKALKELQTVKSMGGTSTAKIGKKTSQCVDLSLVAEYICSKPDRVGFIRGAQKLVIANLGYGTVDRQALKIKLLNGVTLDIDGQKVLVQRSGDTVSLYAEKWVYSNSSHMSESSIRNSLAKIGDLAHIVGADTIELYNVQFVCTSLEYAFYSIYGNKLKHIKIKDSDMSYIDNLDHFCDGTCIASIEITGTNLNSVRTMQYAFSPHHKSSSELVKIDIPDTPNLENARGMFGGCKIKDLSNLKFLECAKLKDVDNMFINSGIEVADLENIDITECISLTSMFERCRNLRRVNLGSKPLTKLLYADQLFNDCSSLMEADVYCINSPGLKMKLEDYLPCSECRSHCTRTRTFKMFAGVNKGIRIRTRQSLIDIIKHNQNGPV